MKVTLNRRNKATQATIDLDVVNRLVSAQESGVSIAIDYVNLSGSVNSRRCFVKELRGFEAVISGEFGYRSVCLERVLGVGI